MPAPKQTENMGKVTLSIPESVLEAARDHASRQVTSLSKLVTRLLSIEAPAAAPVQLRLTSNQRDTLATRAKNRGVTLQELIIQTLDASIGS